MRSVSLVGEERVDDKRPRRVGKCFRWCRLAAEDFEILSKRTQPCIPEYRITRTRKRVIRLILSKKRRLSTGWNADCTFRRDSVHLYPHMCLCDMLLCRLSPHFFSPFPLPFFPFPILPSQAQQIYVRVRRSLRHTHQYDFRVCFARVGNEQPLRDTILFHWYHTYNLEYIRGGHGGAQWGIGPGDIQGA